MICSKCNSEIPSGAKFCTVCGTPCSSGESPAAKSFCAKCGMELAQGAKFCTSCGTPAAANTAPVVNDAQASAVSLNKEPSADDLVAAMNTAAPAAPAAPAAVPTPAPTPAAAVPTPVPTPAPASVPTPVASAAPAQAPAASVMPQPGYNNGFAPTGAPNAPEMPNFAPTGGMMPPAGDAAGFNGAAVAAAAAPAKAKKSPVGKIILIISIVLVAIIGAAAAWFFSNKASFLSTFMGKPKYAAMVEKETFKKVSKDLDAEALSSQIKTATSVAGVFVSRAIDQMSTLTYPTAGNLYLSDKTAAGAEYADMMNVYSNNLFEGVDVQGMIQSYHEYMQSTYGANAITGNISVNVKDLGGLDDADDILKILNGATITYDYAATEDALGALFGMEFDNGSRFDIKSVVEDDGSIYIAFPFASKTGFKYKTTPTSGSSAAQGTAGLDLEPEEITRLLEEVMDIYTDHVKKASVSMGNGSLNVAGKEVSGKLIVADINGKNLENLFKEIFEHIANDEYFCTQIVEYINNYDPDYTTSDFKNDVTDLVSDMNEITEEQKLVIRTIVNNSGKTLAKSFAFVDEGEQFFEIAFADNDTESAFDLKVDGESFITATNVKTDDKNGTATINISTMESTDSFVSIIMDYSDVDTVDFGKSKVEVGTYNISLNIPRSLDIDSETLDMLNNSSFTCGTTVSGNTINYNIGATISGVAKFDLKMDLTISDDTSVLSAPSDVIDITDIVNGEEPDQATQTKLQNFLADLMNAVENSGLEEIFGDLGSMGPIGGVTPTPQPGPGTQPNSDIMDKYEELGDAVFDAYFEVYDWIDAYDVYSGDAYDNAVAYRESLSKLYNELFDTVNDDNNELSEKQLEEFTKKFNEIYKDAESILKGLWAASTIPNAPSPTLPFDPDSGIIDPTPSGGVYDANGNLITTPAFAPDQR